MPQKSHCSLIGCALIIVAVFGAIALIADKLCCHLISFYATFGRSPKPVRDDCAPFDEEDAP